jgi:Ca-activated chloride channel family protein
MERENRLELVKRSLGLLVDALRPADEIGIAVYGSNGKEVLGHTPLSEGKEVILRAIDVLKPGGSTNAEEGLRIGYELAGRAYKEGRINRVILCSDGVANVGKTGPDSILAVIEEQVKKGICLTTVGFGMDNYNDVLMERLGDKGNGHYAYVDDIKEARRVFVEGLSGTLQVIARDVKIQVEFNPRAVRSYRLLGYENRNVADKYFRNDKVDGGEVGAGHSVTALYEVKMWAQYDPAAPLGWFRIRYKNPDYADDVSEYQTVIRENHFVKSMAEASTNFRLASCAAQFAEILRKSHWAEGLSMACPAEEAIALAAEIPADKKIAELHKLMMKASTLIKALEGGNTGLTSRDGSRASGD